jgi:hypothetical protein
LIKIPFREFVNVVSQRSTSPGEVACTANISSLDKAYGAAISQIVRRFAAAPAVKPAGISAPYKLNVTCIPNQTRTTAFQ